MFIVTSMLFLMATAVSAEMKTVICPLFDKLGDQSPCMAKATYEEVAGYPAIYNEKLRTAPALTNLLAEGYKILKIDSIASRRGDIATIILQKTEMEDTASASTSNTVTQNDIETLKKDIEALKAENSKLKKDIEAIKKQLSSLKKK